MTAEDTDCIDCGARMDGPGWTHARGCPFEDRCWFCDGPLASDGACADDTCDPYGHAVHVEDEE